MTPWNDTPMRPAPWTLRGLKTDREPWAEDAAIYNKKIGVLNDRREAYEQVNVLTRHLLEVPKPDGSTWDSSVFRNAPWQLRGLKPVTREPWCRDAAIYNAKFIDDPLEAAGGTAAITSAYLDGTFGASDYRVRDKDGTYLTQREEELHRKWDSTTWRYTPHVLKGIRPVTKEPWARDEAVYNESRNSIDFREGVIDTPTLHNTFGDGVKDEAEWNTSRVPHPGVAYPK